MPAKKQDSLDGASEEKKIAPIRTSKIDDNVLVKVKSTYFGRLFYRNQRSGDSVEWEHAGDVQVMSMGDLRAMRAQQSSFFKNQWILILGVDEGSGCKATCEDIYNTLTLNKFYENYVEPTNAHVVCSWSEEDIREKVSMMSQGARENLVVALNGFIKDGTLDSMRKIRAFEEALGCQLRTID